MAMYENRGFCPHNSFLHYNMNGNEVNPLWETTGKILGDRPGYMVYDKAMNAYKGECYIVDAMMGGTGTLGLEIACALRSMIPVCKYSETGRPIVCADLLNPYQIPAAIGQLEDEWKLCEGEDPAKTVLVQDDRYLVAIQDDGNEVKVYLFKQ